MIEDADSSKGQLLRADHLFHVTLKYTRTADVIKNTIKRLVNSLEYAISEILERKKLKNIPPIALMRADFLKKKYPRNANIQKIVKFYLHLKKIDKGEFKTVEEYRKGVGIVVGSDKIDIPKLREFLDKTKELVKIAQDIK